MEPISRRTVLRGIGVTMALPLLEAMAPKKVSAASVETFPTRLAVLYMPNGVNPNAWTPKGVGSEFVLSEILAPLAKHQSEILVLTELMNKGSIPGDGHYYKIAPFLTGTEITKTTGANLNSGGVSLDQLIAQQIGNFTPIPSLELSVDPPTTYVDTNVGLTALYGSHISWSTPTTPVSREINPQAAFDRLFKRSENGGLSVTKADQSILDAVQADANALKKKLGAADTLKLEEYFDSVRAVEKRIAFDATRRKHQILDDQILKAEVTRLGDRIKSWYAVPGDKRPLEHTEQVRIMMDLMVLGFWTDSTRVATFLFGNEVSGRNFSFLDGVHGGHHEYSHHENKADKLDAYKRIGIWHLTQYAYLLERMRGIKEGDKTLLDNSMVLLGSGIKDGNAHSPYNLPIVLAGRGGGSIATGRHLIYDAKTPLCNLHLGLLRRMGVTAGRFGDSTGELAGLSDPKFTGLSVKA
jgi:hypothetical protein